MEVRYKITDNKNKYGSKSISGYKKSALLKEFEKSLVNGDYYTSMYFATEMTASGYFKDFWTIVFTVMSEYIHILSPDLPKAFHDRYLYSKNIEKEIKGNKYPILTARNLLEIQRNITFVVKNICNSRKKHSSFFIRSVYNHQKKAPANIGLGRLVPLFKELKKIIRSTVSDKIGGNAASNRKKDLIFNYIGKLLVVDSENINVFARPYNIVLYHHDRSEINKNIMTVLWNILLKTSIYNEYVERQITALKDIYELKLLNKKEKETYILLNALYYFIYTATDSNLKPINNTDMIHFSTMYENIQTALNTFKPRNDYIKITDNGRKKKDKKIIFIERQIPKSKKQSKSKKTKIIKSKPIKEPIEAPVNMFEEEIDVKEYEDDLLYSNILTRNAVAKQKKVEKKVEKPQTTFVKEAEVESIEDEGLHVNDFMFNFDDLEQVHSPTHEMNVPDVEEDTTKEIVFKIKGGNTSLKGNKKSNLIITKMG